MKEVQKIAQKVLILLMDILIFTWQVVRRVILPNRSRKGNVLTSLLAFFVGLLERIVSFEKSILQRPVVFSHKYVRQGLIIVLGFFFLLSSLEWTIGPSADAVGNGSPNVVACAPTPGSARKLAPQRVNASVESMAAWFVAWLSTASISPSRTDPPIATKRWLRLGVSRI
jgi:hypothetical protein